MSNYHNISCLINDDDVYTVLSLVQEECKIVCSTVARLYYSENEKWILYETGLILIVKDYNNKRYYIEFYDIDNGSKMFVEKVGKSFEYWIFDNNLHIINSGSSCVLLSLADYSEGLTFSEFMQKLTKNKNSKESMEKAFNSPSHEENVMDLLSTEKPIEVEIVEEKKTHIRPSIKFSLPRRKFHKSNSDVGLPYNFRHLDHVGQQGYFLREVKHGELKDYLTEINMEYLIDENEIDKPPDGLLISDSNFYDIKSTLKSDKFPKRRINKNDIGKPKNFIHAQHMGMNNFDFSTLEKDTVTTHKASNLDLKTGKMHISKSDISIPTNFRHIEHFGDKNPIYDDD